MLSLMFNVSHLPLKHGTCDLDTCHPPKHGPRYISAEGYAFNGLVNSEFSGVNMTCTEGLDERTIQALPDFLPNTTQLTR